MATFNLSDNFAKFESETQKSEAASSLSSGLYGALPSFTDNGDGTFDVGACDIRLYDNDRMEGALTSYHIDAIADFDVTSFQNGVFYLLVDYNNGSPIYVNKDANWLAKWDTSSIVPIYTCFNENNTLIHHMSWDGQGQGLSDKNFRRILKTQRFARENGGDIGVADPARSVHSDKGIFWTGSIEHQLPPFDSGAVEDAVSTINITNAGTGYTDDTYTNVPAETSGGSGTGLLLRVVVIDGEIYEIYPEHGSHGSGWVADEVIVFTNGNADVGGTGSSATFTANAIGHRFYWYHWTGTGLTVDITTVGGGGDVTAIAVNTAGAGYIVGDTIPVLGGTGTGFQITVDTINATGGVTAISIASAGTGYQATDDNLSVYQGWSYQVTTDGTGVYDNTRYDGGDGTHGGGGVAGVNEVDDGEYIVNWVYRDVDEANHLAIVLGEHPFGTLAEAQGSTPRSDLLRAFAVIGFLIGRVIIVKNGTTADVVESAFREFQPSLVTSHSALSGLQGGQEDEYFHVTSAEQQHLTDGLSVCISVYSPKPAKNAVENVHGAIHVVTSPASLNSSTPIDPVDTGQSKLMVVVGGVTTGGNIRIVGATIDRNTGVLLDDGVSEVTVTAAGSGYDSDGTYPNVLGTGTGTDIRVTVVVSGGSVTSVVVDEDQVGTGWTVADAITILDADIGGRTGGVQATYQVATAGDFEVLTIDVATTNNSTTDANGVDQWDFTNGYLTSKWFENGCTVTAEGTTDLTNTEICQVTFEQFDDKSNVIIDSIDAKFYVTNTNASMSLHFYKVAVTGDKVSISEIISDEVWEAGGARPFPTADRFYRVRRGNINEPIDGRTDGIFVQMAWLGTTPYFEDVGLKIWARIGPDIA